MPGTAPGARDSPARRAAALPLAAPFPRVARHAATVLSVSLRPQRRKVGFGWRHSHSLSPTRQLLAWERGLQSCPQPSQALRPRVSRVKWASELLSLPPSREIGQWHNEPSLSLLTVSVMSPEEGGRPLGSPRGGEGAWRPQEGGAGPRWPQGMGLCLAQRGRETGGAESWAGPVVSRFYLRSQQPYPPPPLPVPRPSHGRELCECLGAWAL